MIPILAHFATTNVFTNMSATVQVSSPDHLKHTDFSALVFG